MNGGVRGDVLVALQAEGRCGHQLGERDLERTAGSRSHSAADDRVDLAEPPGSRPPSSTRPRGRDAGRAALWLEARLAPSWAASASSTPLSAKKSADARPPPARPRERAQGEGRDAVWLERGRPRSPANSPPSTPPASDPPWPGRRGPTRTGRRARRRGRRCSAPRRAASRAAWSAAPTAPAREGSRPGSAPPGSSSPGESRRPGRPGSARLRLTTASKPGPASRPRRDGAGPARGSAAPLASPCGRWREGARRSRMRPTSSTRSTSRLTS